MAYPPLIEAFLLPRAYPSGERPRWVEQVETHVSDLFFLTGAAVCKVKKPVDFGFLDSTTMEKRHHYYRQELLLTRRLSPEVYVGVAEVRRGPRGYAFDGAARVRASCHRHVQGAVRRLCVRR